jgi:hypothetical protein
MPDLLLAVGFDIAWLGRWLTGIGFILANAEQSGLLLRVPTQFRFVDFIQSALGFLVFSLSSALDFVPLLLLPRLFFLALVEC